jgi:3-oxoadipate enol-lactonase
MTAADEHVLAAEVRASTRLPEAAARLLLRLAAHGPLPASAFGAADARAALAALERCGAAAVDEGLVRHRPASWRLARLAVRGTRLGVQTCGAGEALVLAPAFGTCHALWGTPWVSPPSQLAAFSRRYRTICVDYRGTGCSDIDDAPYSLEDCAADLDAVLERLRVRRAHFLGVSLGGGVVLRAALLRPARVASLVLCATNASALDAAVHAKAERLLAEAPRRSLDWALRAYLQTPLTAGASAEELAAMLALGARSVRTLENFLNLYRANVFRSDVRARLGELRMPALVLVGAHDERYFQDDAGVLAAGIAGAVRINVPRAGHMVWAHDRPAFDHAVLDFLARHPLDARARACA